MQITPFVLGTTVGTLKERRLPRVWGKGRKEKEQSKHWTSQKGRGRPEEQAKPRAGALAGSERELARTQGCKGQQPRRHCQEVCH